MRSHCAIYVDVGYLLAAAATRVTGTSLRRGVQVNHQGLVQGLIAQAEQDSGLPLLRVNWYDSGARPRGMPDIHQEEIGLLPKVKLRLGRLSYSGEQKGVDLRIGLDLALQGRGRIVDVMYLVSGDDDLTEAVEEAQSHGVQVIVMAVPHAGNRPHAVARHLQQAADGLILIDGHLIDSTVLSTALAPELIPDTAAAAAPDATPAGVIPEPAADAAKPQPVKPVPRPPGAPRPAVPAPGAPKPAASGPSPAALAHRRARVIAPQAPTPTPQVWLEEVTPGVTYEVIDSVARQVVTSWCATATPEGVTELRNERPLIPNDLDRTLLLDLVSRIEGFDLDDAARHALRDRFWELVDRIKLG